MIVGMILAGCVTGAIAAGAAFVLGQGILTALLIYAGAGSVCVLLAAVCAALRPDPTRKKEAGPRQARLQRS